MKNRSTKTILVFFALGLISWALCVQQAQAIPINGAINFGGGVEMNGTADTATQVTGWLDQGGFMPTVQGADGSFAGLDGLTATFPSPWSFNYSGPTFALWTVGGFTFNLIASSIDFQGGGFLNVSGTGTITGNSFTATLATWNFSIQDDGPDGVFSWSGGSQAPDGGPTVALLGLALAGIEGIRRKLMRSKS